MDSLQEKKRKNTYLGQKRRYNTINRRLGPSMLACGDMVVVWQLVVYLNIILVRKVIKVKVKNIHVDGD